MSFQHLFGVGTTVIYLILTVYSIDLINALVPRVKLWDNSTALGLGRLLQPLSCPCFRHTYNRLHLTGRVQIPCDVGLVSPSACLYYSQTGCSSGVCKKVLRWLVLVWQSGRCRRSSVGANCLSIHSASWASFSFSSPVALMVWCKFVEVVENHGDEKRKKTCLYECSWPDSSMCPL